MTCDSRPDFTGDIHCTGTVDLPPAPSAEDIAQANQRAQDSAAARAENRRAAYAAGEAGGALAVVGSVKAIKGIVHLIKRHRAVKTAKTQPTQTVQPAQAIASTDANARLEAATERLNAASARLEEQANRQELAPVVLGSERHLEVVTIPPQDLPETVAQAARRIKAKRALSQGAPRP